MPSRATTPVDRYFQISERGSTVSRELRGGLATFFAMAYIIVLNPIILASAQDKFGHHLDNAQLVTATALIAGITTVLMGVIGNVPIALAAGLGINAVVALQLAPKMSWPDAMGMVVLAGLVLMLLVASGLRQRVMDAIPNGMRRSIAIGIGLFIALIGLVFTPLATIVPSFVVDTEPDILPELEAECGIDLGLSAFAVLSDGTKIDSPRFLRRAEKKLKRLQRELSRKAKRSKNRARARIKVARQHAKVADRRRDWHHKASTQIIRDNQAVYVEDLAVSGLGRTRLAKSVHDAGWSTFVGMLEYKAVKHGRTFAKVDRAFPSSQVCSACGFRDGPKPLHVREWTCGECGTVHDRDHNAARNVLFEGRRTVAAGRAETPNASWSAGKTRAKAPAQRGEAGSPRKGQPTQAGIPGL